MNSKNNFKISKDVNEGGQKMFRTIVGWCFGLAFVTFPGVCAIGNDDTIGKIKADYQAIQSTMENEQVVELSSRCVQIVESNSSKDEALTALAFIQHLSIEKPLADVAKNLAIASERYASRFETEAINQWQPVFSFLWYNIRRPPADVARKDQVQTINDLRDFLDALHDEAESDYMKAIALYVKIENRLAFERDVGVLSKAEREKALSDVKTLLEQFGTLKKPHKRDKKWQESFSYYANGQLTELGKLYVGAVAPDIEGIDLNGEGIKLSDYRGRVVLLSFWGAWCGPCLASVPKQRDLLDRTGNKSFAIVGVNTDSELETAKDAKDKHQIVWRSIWNGPTGWEGNIAADWFVQGYPLYYVLDRDGRIRFKSREYEGIEQIVEKLLDDKTSELNR